MNRPLKLSETDSEPATREAIWPHIIEVMKAGGYYDRVMSAGPELDRVKQYLSILEGTSQETKAPYQDTSLLPVFPGLDYRAVYSAREYSALSDVAETLKASYQTILAEADGIDYQAYTEGGLNGGRWDVFPICHMGERLPTAEHVPLTTKIVESLSLSSHVYPWSDMIFSSHEPKTHLLPHYSVDSVRIRCHLGLRVPAGCWLRVAGQTLTWKENEVLFFSDSYRHETYNGSSEQRVVLIVDLWHPSLSKIEIDAITAGFRKREIREWFINVRIPEDCPYSSLRSALFQRFRESDNDTLMKEYWDVT
ncbi:aspartyl/asparaginyl beta-hydroxylase domain-containing protein [Noviherbaspirillum sp.]|uniref:aspartyl/asparaginyl beta-hydroxylase domain-containing protein n=1 Tax=Noviherbaspirillum sp. TaxID=1926288 RepID=UPI002FE1D9F3